MFKTVHEGLAFLICGALLALVAPQNPTTPPQPKTPTPSKPAATAENQDPDHSDLARRTDHVLAAWLIVDNNNEVALSKIALERSKNEDVKRFAKMMVDDHTAFAAKLREFAPSVGGLDGMQDETKTIVPKSGTPETMKPAADTTKEDGTRRAKLDEDSRPMHAGALDHIELVRELGRKCLESSKMALNEKQDAEFDHCFMGMQVMMHQKAEDTLEVFQRYASPNLRSSLDSGLQTVRRHQDEAKRIMKAMEPSIRGDMQQPKQPAQGGEH